MIAEPAETGNQQGGAAEIHLRRWELEADGAPIASPYGMVVFVRRAGRKLVLKIPAETDRHAAQALRHFDGNGTVRLIEANRDAVLLERAEPGNTLTGLVLAGRDDAATEILCGVAKDLHRPALPEARFARVEDWGQGFARYRRTGDRTIAASLLDRAERLFRELADTQQQHCLLHGDLHHDNIVHDRQRGWLAIDPKGVVGEPAYEFGAALRNPTDDPAVFADPAILTRRADIIARMPGLDRSRILHWAFAQAVLSAIWSIEDGQDPMRGLATAEAAARLL